MKVRKIIARNMSEGLKAVTAELGEDAMILSNRKVERGVEILAAVRGEQDDLTASAAPSPARPIAESEPPRPAAPKASRPAPARQSETMEDSILRMSEQDEGGLTKESLMSLLNTHKDPLEQKRKNLRAQLSQHQDDPMGWDQPAPPKSSPRAAATAGRASLNTRAAPERRQATKRAARPAAEPELDLERADQQDRNELDAMREELAALREWLQSQTLKGLDSSVASHPLAGRLQKVGFDDRCVTPLVEKYRRQPLADAWTLSVENLSRLVSKNAQCLIQKGGIAALVGPTGAGKTTTLSKIATRFAMQHGPEHLAIISLDQFRIGAHEPVRILGRILGCEVVLADHADSLEEQLAGLGEKKLILIDTNGSLRGLEAFQNQRGDSLLERQIQPLLVLPANLSRHSLQAAWARFGALKPRGLILTKTDESPEIGPVLSLSLLKKIPLTYWSDGTLVPQDLHFGQVGQLIEQSYRHLDNAKNDANLVRIG